MNAVPAYTEFSNSQSRQENTPKLISLSLAANTEEKARWLVAIARQYVQAGNTTQASQILAQALQVTLMIKGPESKTLVFGMPPDITVVDDDSDRGSFLEAIALEYAKAGQHTQAQQVAQRLENNAIRDLVKSTVSLLSTPLKPIIDRVSGSSPS
jgi:hypothetical protein